MDVGDHIYSPRLGYSHHGIYIGDGKVIHYSGLADGLESGAIEEITLSGFRGIWPVFVEYYLLKSPKYQGQAAVDRARSRLGEDMYSVWTNNCEHFVNWCLHGESSSPQLSRAAMGAAAMLLPQFAVPVIIATQISKPEALLTPALSVLDSDDSIKKIGTAAAAVALSPVAVPLVAAAAVWDWLFD